MDDRLQDKLVAALMTLLFGLGLVAFTSHKTIPVQLRTSSPGFGWSWDFDYERAMREPFLTTEDLPAASPNEPLVFAIDEPVRVGALEITYQGRKGSDTILFSVVVPALDATYAYPHAVRIDEARKGFSLVDERFRLTAVGKAVVRLKHEPFR